jgi:serine/threonine protein phosphatase PrpC
MDPMDGNHTPAGTTRLGLRYSALSDVGRVRKDNQDSGFASPNLLVVADGVGGAARGDVASSTAVQALRRLDGPPPEDLLEALAGAVHRAHDRIAELVEQNPEFDGTSTTVTAALFDGRQIGVAHVGDSRGYLLRDGTLSQLTKDHTFVQGLIDEGRITEDEARNHPHRNLILRAVDGVHETDPDLFEVELAPGDRLLLCSDGASGVLPRDRLTDILTTGSVDYAAVELVRASLEAGSSDNVTCVVADVYDPATDENDDPSAAAATGPMLVGAAAEQPRRAQASKVPFRGHRGGDTGELEPVDGNSSGGQVDGREHGRGEVDPEELRYAPQAPRRGRWARGLAALLVIAVVAVTVGIFAYRWSQRQYFVAANHKKVAIYRGVQADIPGLTMNRVAEGTNVTVAALPDYPAQQVRSGISADSLAAAREIVDRLTGLARVCPTATPSPTPSQGRSTPSASASPTSPPAPTASAARGTVSAAPSPKPSAATPSRPTSKGTGPRTGPTKSPTASPTLAPPQCIEASS